MKLFKYFSLQLMQHLMINIEKWFLLQNAYYLYLTMFRKGKASNLIYRFTFLSENYEIVQIAFV